MLRMTICCALLASSLACETGPKIQGRALSSWVADLDADLDFRRRQACEAIAEAGLQAASAVDALVPVLEDTNTGVQEFARAALVAIGKPAVPRLEPLLDRSEPGLRAHAAIALVAIDPTHDAGRAALAELLTAVGNTALVQAAHDQVVATGAPMVPDLLPSLADPYEPVRVQVLKTLRAMEKQAAAAIPRLVELGKSEQSPAVRQELAATLARIGSREQVEAPLREMAAEAHPRVAATANEALAYIGAIDRPTLEDTQDPATPPPAPAPREPEKPLRSLLSE